MEKAIFRQRILLEHLQPNQSSNTSPILSASNCAAGDGYFRSSCFGDDVVIVAAYRTAICKAKRGGFKDTLADDLLAPVLKALIDKTNINPTEVGDIVVGTVLAPGSVRAIECRMAAFYAGFPDTVPLRTVNRQCSSGLQAVADVAAAIRCGYYDIGIAAGLESMSTDKVSLGKPANPKLDLFAQARDCLLPMGITSENVAHRFGITRQEQDQAAVESHRKAAAAAASGKFKEEIIPVETKIVDPKTGEEKKITVMADDGIRPDTSLEALAKLKPAFTKDGSTTAGNASQVSDGAGAVLLMRRDVAMKKGLPILGVYRSFAAVGVDPAVMGVGPAVAIPAAVKAAGLKVDDIDLFEINEAFASQYVYCCKKLGLDPKKVNVNGGAMALGHPLGATGARCVSTLLNEMKRRGKDCRFGVISMCIGSGMGAAAVIERGDIVDELSNAKTIRWKTRKIPLREFRYGPPVRITCKLSKRTLLSEAITLGAMMLYTAPVLSAPLQDMNDPDILRYYKLENGVKIQDIVDGEGTQAREGDLVEFNYVCRRSNGYFVHSTVDQFSGESSPVILPLDDREILRGLRDVLVGMKAGGKIRALIPPELGYVNENL